MVVPFGNEGVEDTIGLAMSGGGFRATLFHIGSLWRLNELGLLPQLGRISSVSGGSIASGRLARVWRDLIWSDRVARNFQSAVADPLRAFCRRHIDKPAVFKGIFTPGRSTSDYVEAAYAEAGMLGPMALRDLPDQPRFIFNATNLQTGRDFRFSKPYMGDYRIGLVYNPDLPLARAVAASSAFPPLLSPVILEHPGPFIGVPGADLHDQPAYTRRIYLTDGGAYDNLGLQTVENRCRTLLVSDAGAPFDLQSDENVGTNWVAQPLRALDIATDQARGLRKSALIDAFCNNRCAGTYWGIGTDIGAYKLPDTIPTNPLITQKLSRIRTRLNPFSDEEQGQLINWGYALCDTALRRHASQLLPAPLPNWSWPCPGQKLG